MQPCIDEHSVHTSSFSLVVGVQGDQVEFLSAAQLEVTLNYYYPDIITSIILSRHTVMHLTHKAGVCRRNIKL